MTRLEFAKILLSRLIEASPEILDDLCELVDVARVEFADKEHTGQGFDETAQTVSELIFPEQIGDLVLR